MSAPRFSVIIPTRERADTLRFALRTCLNQAFDNYEVIVSDNCSSPATQSVVTELASPKVRYVRTTEPVAMSTNWEFGVSHAQGEYVILIGDDDALLPHALTELDRLVCDNGAKVIRWTPAYYTWPTITLPGQGNYLRLPLGCGLCERDGAEVIRAVATFREFYTELPMLYNAAVHRDVLDNLRSRVGRVFPHPIPDVYSGFAVAHAAGKFLTTSVPMTISGQSHASNGIAALFNRSHSAVADEFFALNLKEGLAPEAMVPDLPVFPEVPVADAFVFAKRALFPELPVELDRKVLSRACVTKARVNEGEWPVARAAVRAALADSPELQAWFDSELADETYVAPPPVRLRPVRLGADREFIHLDSAAFGVTDVAGAADLCERLLGYRRDGVKFRPESFDSGAVSLFELQEKEALIQRLHGECQLLIAECEMLRHEAQARLNLLELQQRQIELLDKAVVVRDSQLQDQLQEIEQRKQGMESLKLIVSQTFLSRAKRFTLRMLKHLAFK